MKLRELYPYWSDVHWELCELLDILDDDIWTAKRVGSEGRTIRQIMLHVIDFERFWINHIAQRLPYEAITSREFSSNAEIIDQFRATRVATDRFIEGLSLESLKSVRTAPEDIANNEPERNVQIGWIIWHVLEHEIYHWGQIVMRASD